MSARIIPFPRRPVRALVVEQLNESHWHIVIEPNPSAWGSGVYCMTEASRVVSAMARRSGLPVLVAWYRRPRITLNQARRRVPMPSGGAA